MALHIWKVKNYQPSTVREGVEAFFEALSVLDVGGAIAFAGYAVESMRQSGRGAPRSILGGAKKSGHRYASGRNALNYRIGGARMLSAALRSRIELGSEGLAILRAFEESGDPTALSVFCDYLDDNGLEDPTEIRSLVRLSNAAPHLRDES